MHYRKNLCSLPHRALAVLFPDIAGQEIRELSSFISFNVSSKERAGDGVGGDDVVAVGGDVVQAQACRAVECAERATGGISARAFPRRLSAENDSERAFSARSEQNRKSELGDFPQTRHDLQILFRCFSEAETGINPKLIRGNAAF